MLKLVADKLEAAKIDSVTQANTRVVLFANCRGVYKALQDIAASECGQYYPIGLLPLGKSNDVSRVSGWGNVHKQDWTKRSTAPDLVSAITVAPEVKVDYWSVRAASSDRGSLEKMPASFKKEGKDVRLLSSLLVAPACALVLVASAGAVVSWAFESCVCITTHVALGSKAATPSRPLGLVCCCLQSRESYAWNSVYFALDEETANGLSKLVVPSARAATVRGRHRGILNKFCCGSESAADTPIAVQLELANQAGDWRRVDVPSNVAAIMVENLPKRWAKGDDFWDNREAGVRFGHRPTSRSLLAQTIRPRCVRSCRAVAC